MLPAIADCECTCPQYDPPKIRALTVRQPFASLIVYGNKTLEIRSRRTNHRGQLLICAGANEHDGQMIDPDIPGRVVPCSRYLQQTRALSPTVEMFPVGVAVGIVELVDCRPMTPDDARRACVEFRPGLFAWELENPLLIEPFPVTGNVGLFNVNQSLIEFK
jgi:hypothetical protein